jgi:2-oxoglutarate dehydrogenase complex dehydrogenase (E1) component-like enzyme
VSQVYAGRLAAASPATGSSKIHDQEQNKLILDAFA